MHKRYFTSVTLLLLALTLAGCGLVAGAADVPLAERPIRVVATTGMVADIVRNVGGARVQVEGLMGPGVDPHLYKASAGDVNRLQAADAIFYNGLHLEAQMGKVFERMAGPDLLAVPVAEGIDPAGLLAPPEYEGSYDPHVWFSVPYWQTAVREVEAALSALDPQHAPLYAANAAAYLDELDALDAYVREQAATVPPAQRVLITAHDAFGYFGREYGFEVRGLQGISTAAEPSTADVSALARFIAERRIPAIFVESSVPPRTVEAVQAAVRDQGWDVQIGGELFSDAMGSAGTPEGTYIGMVRHNIDTIAGALRGEP